MKQKIDFVNENTGKALLKMVMPLFMAMILMLAYTLVDSIWVGNLLGENGYAALTTAGSVSIILYAITTGIGNGTSVIVSQLVGAGNKEKTDKVISTSLILSVIFPAAVILVLECLLNQLLLVFQTPTLIYQDAKDYLAIFLIGFIAIFLYMQLTSIFRSFGDPVFQMKGMLLGTVFNAIADPLFIKAFGISGAAIATVLSQVLCLIFAIIYGMKKSYFTLNLKGFDGKTVLQILKTVVPTSLQSCTPAVSSMIMVILVNRFDVTTIAAYGVVKNIENILFYPAMAMNMALITIMGQLYGAKRGDRMKDYMKAAFLYGIVIEAVLTILVLLFSTQISMAFVREAAVAQIVSRGLKIIGIGYLCYMATNIFTAKMAGMGRVNLSMILMFTYYIVIRVPLAIVLIRGSLLLDGMWIAILVSHIVALFIAFVINRKIRIEELIN
ncbi:MAG: MATE family efflux transporter [bacterium]|nr:MATE family efflux transporter [bacterium]